MDITLYKSNRWRLVKREWEGQVQDAYVLKHRCSNVFGKIDFKLLDNKCLYCKKKPGKNIIVLINMLCRKKIWTECN